MSVSKGISWNASATRAQAGRVVRTTPAASAAQSKSYGTFAPFSCPDVGSLWSVYDDRRASGKVIDHITIVATIAPLDIHTPNGRIAKHGFLPQRLNQRQSKAADAEQFVVIYNTDEAIRLLDDKDRIVFHKLPTVLLSNGRIGLLLIDKRLCHRIA